LREIISHKERREHLIIMIPYPKYSETVALQKLRKYCAYQERCHQEVKTKILSWNFPYRVADQFLVQLIEEGFLNEERFAKAFAGGKFRQKGWGRLKIINALKQKGISPYLINSSMKEIRGDDYQVKLEQLLKKKMPTLKAENEWIMKQKLARFAISKGYENEMVWISINSMINEQ